MRARNCGFMIMDVLIALLLLGVIMVLMAQGLNAHRRVASRLASTTNACAAAESALTDLQQGKPAANVKIQKLTGGTAVTDFTWVRVSATVQGRTASLVGLVKSSSVKGN